MSIIENKRLEAAVVMRTLLVAVLSLLALTEMSDAAQSDLIISRRGQDLTPALRLLPADHPLGTGATVTLVSLEQVASVHELTLSAFIVDYAPGRIGGPSPRTFVRLCLGARTIGCDQCFGLGSGRRDL